MPAWYWLRTIGSALQRSDLPTVLRRVNVAARGTRGRPRWRHPRPLCDAVERCARNFLREYTCLPRALAGYVMCTRDGHDVDLRVGVRLPAVDSFHAHAWLEYRGEVVLGDSADLADYVPFGREDRLLRM
ncbi:MAG: lasso peptide biosynthesis B2 protein [bacterium]